MRCVRGDLKCMCMVKRSSNSLPSDMVAWYMRLLFFLLFVIFAIFCVILLYQFFGLSVFRKSCHPNCKKKKTKKKQFSSYTCGHGADHLLLWKVWKERLRIWEFVVIGRNTRSNSGIIAKGRKSTNRACIDCLKVSVEYLNPCTAPIASVIIEHLSFLILFC